MSICQSRESASNHNSRAPHHTPHSSSSMAALLQDAESERMAAFDSVIEKLPPPVPKSLEARRAVATGQLTLQSLRVFTDADSPFDSGLNPRYLRLLRKYHLTYYS